MENKTVHLPHELIIEILLRLPVKTLLCCKCVSKSWLSIISDPNFATSHFQLSSASPTHRLLILESDALQTLTIDFNASLKDDSAYASRRLDVFCPRFHDGVGVSCRGFLLLHSKNDLYLWNPSTGVHKQIPRSPIMIDSIDYYIYMFLHGFAYDQSTDDYLVVLGSYEYDDNDPSDSVCSWLDLEIFSLRANKWKKIEGGSDLPYLITDSYVGSPKVGLFFNEAIHWMINENETLRDVIIAFDLKEMRISEIALPDDFDYHVLPVECDLFEFDGQIGAWLVE